MKLYTQKQQRRSKSFTIVQGGQNVLLSPAEMFILMLQVIPLQLQYCHTMLRTLRHTTQTLTVQGIRLCSIILINDVPWDIFQSICGVTRLKARLTPCLSSSVV